MLVRAEGEAQGLQSLCANCVGVKVSDGHHVASMWRRDEVGGARGLQRYCEMCVRVLACGVLHKRVWLTGFSGGVGPRLPGRARGWTSLSSVTFQLSHRLVENCQTWY